MTVDEIDEGMRIEGPKSDPLKLLPEQGVDLERSYMPTWSVPQPAFCVHGSPP